MNPVYRLFATINSLAPTILRVLLTVVFAIHGGQKTLGWLGGEGWKNTLAHWTAAPPDGYGLPYGLAMAGIAAEVIGAAGMLLGFLTRVAALGLFCVMMTAVVFVHGSAGFFAPRGYEYPLSLAGVALALICSGGGRFSLDRWLTRALLPPDTGTLGSYRLSSTLD